MAIPDERLQVLIEAKDADAAQASCDEHGYSEGWALCDGALVIYDLDDPPAWFRFERDEDGNSAWSKAVSDAEWPR
jgi:hypothetical protein